MEATKRTDPEERWRIGKVRAVSGLGNSQIRREVKSRRLAEPEILGGARYWRRLDVERWLEQRRAQPRRSFPAADDGREKGHTARGEEAELRDAFARAFDVAPESAVAELRRCGSPRGRCGEVPADARRAAIAALSRIARGA